MINFELMEHYETLHIINSSIDSILNRAGEKEKLEITVNNNKTYFVNLDSLRLEVFKLNKKCVCCGVEGNILHVERFYNQKTPHLNLYHFDSESGRKVLMTKDHIIPKSKGGKDHISNLQTMCCICNFAKSDKDISLEQLKVNLGVSGEFGDWKSIIKAPLKKKVLVTRIPFNGKEPPCRVAWKNDYDKKWRTFGDSKSKNKSGIALHFEPSHFCEIPSFKG